MYLESGGLFTATRQTMPTASVQPVNMEWQEPVQERAPIPVRQEQLLDHFHHDEFVMEDDLDGIYKVVKYVGGPSRARAFTIDSDHGIVVSYTYRR